MNTDTHELEARIAELERKLKALTEYCEGLEDRIIKLAVAKVPEPRFPYWNWQLCRGMSTEERRTLSFVLSILDARVEGSPIAEEVRMDIAGVPLVTVYLGEHIDHRLDPDRD